MAKKNSGKVPPTIESMKPYLDRALNDKEFREDLRDALVAARKLYGPLVKDARDDGPMRSASRLATDEKVQENLRKALEEFGKAADTLKTKKKKRHTGRKLALLAGVIAGALYNPWTGPQTREWLMDRIAGDDDLQPLDSFDLPADDADASLTASENGAPAAVVSEAAEAADADS
jgi:hypothetical protein